MAVIALTSLTGSPGVTAATVAMAMHWPRRVLLVEADVSAGSAIMSGFLRGMHPHTTSILALGAARGRENLVDVLFGQVLALDEAGDKLLLPGISDPAQGALLAPAWSDIASALATLDGAGMDVVIDTGRARTTIHGAAPLLLHADAVLVLTSTHLPDLVATRSHLPALRQDLAQHGTGTDTLALALVDTGPWSRKEIATQIDPTPIVGTLKHDPKAASVYAHGTPPRRRGTSRYDANVLALADAARSVAGAHRERLSPNASTVAELSA